MPKLLDFSAGLIGKQTQYLLLKGQDVEEELTAATKYWRMK
ncbi:MAG TPA: 16S rRNA (guanine(527)-N(7))-methyltransferase RsmG, partial [Alphaproteobacteria bacterium]|nr:16S rRNA (guanine(527)-N(7))-methyltransferase RsmG [Alphaproteobacteria bacterium]